MSLEPLGEREGQQLEFKGADSLRRLHRIAREVVGMLNSTSGGVVWVGIAEEGGQAVRVEPIEDAEKESTRLANHLTDTLEPPPEEGEVSIMVEQTQWGDVLRIEVSGQVDRGPYAQLVNGGRHFHRRFCERNLQMTRQDLERSFSRASIRQDDNVQPQNVGRAGKWVEDPKAFFRVELFPVRDLNLEPSWSKVKAMLMDPALTGNRRGGRIFANPHEEPRAGQGKWVTGNEAGPLTSIERGGRIEFRIPLKALGSLQDPGHLDELGILEYPTSLMRFGRALNSLEGVGAPVDWMANLVITGLRRARLKPHSPKAVIRLRPGEKVRPFPDKVFQLLKPIAINASALSSHPDECAYRLYRQIYEAFGYGEDQVPSEYDQRTGHLNLSE